MWRPLVVSALTLLLVAAVCGETGRGPDQQSEDRKAEEEERMKDMKEFNRLPKGNQRKWDLLMQIAERKERLIMKEIRAELDTLPEGKKKEALKTKLAKIEKSMERFTNTEKYKFGGFGMEKGAFNLNKTPKQ